MSRITLLVIFLSSFLYAQQITQITVVEGESSLLVPSYNHQGTVYVSIEHFAKAVNLKNDILDTGNAFEIFLKAVTLKFNSKNPYVLISDNETKETSIYQFPTSTHFIDDFIFVPARVGDLAISPVKHELWGVQHDAGFATLVYSPYPYKYLIKVKTFEIGDEIFNLSIDDSGKRLAAAIKKASGLQSIIIMNAEEIVNDSLFHYQAISSSGSPENPSWSADGNALYWNAYTNGVSNIYKYDFNKLSLKAITNCVTGLFRPVEILPDSIFAFEFFIDGFRPVIFENKAANFLPAINYLGQKVIEENPQLYTWNLNSDTLNVNAMEFSAEAGYNALENLHLQSLIPMVSGFHAR